MPGMRTLLASDDYDSEDFRDAVKLAMKSTAITFTLLAGKFVITNIIQATKRIKANVGPPEDTAMTGNSALKLDNGEAPPDEANAAAAQDYVRWQRIVANDLENIPITMVLALLSLLFADGTGHSDGLKGTQYTQHTVLLIAFLVSRVLFTVFYAFEVQPFRTLTWFVGIGCTLGLGINACVGVFNALDNNDD